ncbi:MAG: transglycosylase SLT domain-containing protein [Alphaproteobacteria bacterium]
MGRIKSILILPILMVPLVSLGAASSHAVSDAQLVEGAKLCTRYINRYERQFAIPTHLLSAIASTESGRYHKGLKISVPWPWTINVQGKGYYFDSKAEAIAAVKKYRAQGIKSIDVGCMQVNLYHHAKAFRSLDDAFDPKYNVAYAASFLRRLYLDARSWKTAAGHYHSKTNQRGTKYAGSVFDRWHNIIDKLRAAKIQTAQTQTAQTRMASVAKPAQIVRLPEQRGKQVASHQTPRMKVIEVSNKSASAKTAHATSKPKIRVINPNKPMTVAQVAPTTLTITRTAPATAVRSSSARVIQADHSAPLTRSGPNFIFTN